MDSQSRNMDPQDRAKEPLARQRQRIDELDERIVALLNERMDIALEIGRIKARQGISVLDQGREALVLHRLHGLNQGPLSNDDLDRIYRTIMTVSRGLQGRLGNS